MATDKQRYMISVDDALFEKIEDYRFSNRINTRSEATANLIKIGIETVDKAKQEDKQDSDK